MTEAAGREPRVTILLLNWRGWEDTIECLESVLRQSYGNLQVVVCDNDSGDDSLAHIRAWAEGALCPVTPAAHPLHGQSFPPIAKPVSCVEYDRAAAENGGDPARADVPLVLVQTGGNLGYAGGNNVGIQYALKRDPKGYVWLLNNDTVVQPDALRHMVELAEREPGAGMVGAKLMDYDEPELFQAAGGGTLIPWRGLTRHVAEGERDEGQWDEVLEPDYITGASLLVKSEVVAAIGEMDERYFLYSEEVDWCLRAKEQGWRMLYSPKSVVWHKGGQSVQYRSPLHDYHTVRSMLLLVRKFYPRLLPLTFMYSVYRCFAPKIVRGQPERLRAVLRAYRDFYREELAPGAPSRQPTRAKVGR
jgi:GT2 family glycosyltransferase